MLWEWMIRVVLMWLAMVPRPVPEPVVVTTTTSTRVQQAGARDIWWELALCEDGGRNRLYGMFSGYFHFMPETWWGLGYEGYPHEHDYQTQKEAAIMLQGMSGWGQWPGCARKLGLL